MVQSCIILQAWMFQTNGNSQYKVPVFQRRDHSSVSDHMLWTMAKNVILGFSNYRFKVAGLRKTSAWWSPRNHWRDTWVTRNWLTPEELNPLSLMALGLPTSAFLGQPGKLDSNLQNVKVADLHFLHWYGSCWLIWKQLLQISPIGSANVVWRIR